MIFVFDKYCWFVVLVLALVSIGCETTDYEPLLMKKRIKDMEAEIGGLKAEIDDMKSVDRASSPIAGDTNDSGLNGEPEVAVAPSLTAEQEAEVRAELENSDAFFWLNDAGFATGADLVECRNVNDSIAKLVEFPALRKLILEGTNTNAATYDELAKLTNLEHLEIGRSSPDGAAFEKLKALKNLKYIQLLKATISEDAMRVLSEFPSLEQIRCGQTRVGDKELKHLENMNTLKAIDLSDNPSVTVDGLESLSKCPNLSFLKVWGDAIDDEGMKHVANMKSLKVLGLNDTNVSDEGFKLLAELDLQEIHLFRTSMGDESLRVIANMPNVVTLNLRDTRLSDIGIGHLTKLKKLQKLDLSECNSPGITDASGPGLAKFSGLKQLNLWSTKFSDVGLEPVTGLSNLTWLNLDNTNVTDEGVTMLEKMPQLTWIHLGKTEISDASAPSLMKLDRLKYLNISYTKITEDVAYDLDDYFSPKGCTVIIP